MHDTGTWSLWVLRGGSGYKTSTFKITYQLGIVALAGQRSSNLKLESKDMRPSHFNVSPRCRVA